MKRVVSFHLFFLCSFFSFFSIFPDGFLPTTVVKVSDGYVPIEQLTRGTKVVAWEHDSYCITQTKKQTNDHYIKLTCDNVELCLSPHQRVFCANRTRWICAQELQEADTLLCLGGKVVTISALEIVHQEQELCTLTVDVSHTFCVTQHDILAHNFVDLAISTASNVNVSFIANAPEQIKIAVYIARAATVLVGCVVSWFKSKPEKKQEVNSESVTTTQMPRICLGNGRYLDASGDAWDLTSPIPKLRPTLSNETVKKEVISDNSTLNIPNASTADTLTPDLSTSSTPSSDLSINNTTECLSSSIISESISIESCVVQLEVKETIPLCGTELIKVEEDLSKMGCLQSEVESKSIEFGINTVSLPWLEKSKFIIGNREIPKINGFDISFKVSAFSFQKHDEKNKRSHSVSVQDNKRSKKQKKPNKPDDKPPKKSRLEKMLGWLALTNKEARKIAKRLGYREVKNHPCGDTRKQLVFTNGKEYISPDINGHNGGHWKVFNRIGNLLYSMNETLKIIVKRY